MAKNCRGLSLFKADFVAVYHMIRFKLIVSAYLNYLVFASHKTGMLLHF